MFQGSLVALVTPMQKDGSIDKKVLHNLIDWHIQSKTEGLVIAGTTGEGSTLSEKEQYEMLQIAIKQVAKRIPIIAGTGSNCTQHTITLTQNAKNAGADAALIVTPYYNKPSQHGIVEHYKAVAHAVSLPIITYNVPSRTAIDMLHETVCTVAKIPGIIGIKEASGKVERAQQILSHCKNDFVIYSGDDATAMDLMLNGAKGVISVTANVAPQQMHEMCRAALAGNLSDAAKLNKDLMGLHTKLFLEANPIPVKWALEQMNLIPSGIRLPLTPFDAKFHQELKQAMQTAGII
jgi:4-hydroxy-tetrahydrodipicolinate synthase